MPEQLEQRARRGPAPGADRLDRRRGAAAHHDSQAREIAPREIGLLQDGGQRRRRGRDVGDALALDQVERRCRPEAIEQHRLGAGQHRLHERQIAPVEPERQPDQHDVVGRKPEIAVENAAGGERGVVAVHHPLGVAGGSGGERHPHHGVGIRRQPARSPRAAPLAAATSSRLTMPGSGVPRMMPIVRERRQPRLAAPPPWRRDRSRETRRSRPASCCRRSA